MSVSPTGLDRATIRAISGQPIFTPRPLIADILRTRYCIPGSVFLVEAMDSVSVSRTGRWQAIRLMLGDGELCVQTLLGGSMHRFVDTGEVFVGCYIRAENFEVKWLGAGQEGDTDSDTGQPVYLVLHDLVTVGWNDSYRSLWQRQQRKLLEEDRNIREQSLRPNSDVEQKSSVSVVSQRVRSVMPQRQCPNIEDPEDDADGTMEDAFETFEALAFPSKKDNAKASPKLTASSESKRVSALLPLPIALPRDWRDPQSPLKLTTLRSIPRLPYPQNWSCNILAIVVSLSAVEPSHLPPYTQRTARIADPSTTKQIHLTIFLDAEEFLPAIGSAVLLVGVKNHRFDGGSLKKYASDGKDGGRWWFENPWDLEWCDVKAIVQWWAQVQGSLSIN